MFLNEIKKFCETIKNIKKFKDLLIENRFRCIGDGSYSDVYSKDSITYVVKLSRYKTKKIFIPDSNHPLYNSFLLPEFTNKNGDILIQKKVNRNKRRFALSILKEKYKDIIDDLSKYDVGIDNVGWIEETPVIIDCTNYLDF